MEKFYDGTPEGLFALLQEALESGIIPEQIRRCQQQHQEDPRLPSLFTEEELGLPAMLGGPEQELKALAAMAQLRSCSETAFQDCLQAFMSDAPIEPDIIRYAVRILKAPNHTAAEKRRTDRSFRPCEIVLNASQRYLRELDRLLGLLRFKPTNEGYLVARCEPETYALPGLAIPLKRRFGTTAWAVQDEKRNLVLACDGIGEPELASYDPGEPPFSPPEGLVPDEYEALWQEYYHTINIESRKNPELRKRLIPLRYWKYLPELQVQH
ncbi:TIGR03915 family putative DNA repair protein [Gracilinema caldarium]|nr:TIGR03915 family putative DNA repair protein [Gracilinema caldarium]